MFIAGNDELLCSFVNVFVLHITDIALQNTVDCVEVLNSDPNHTNGYRTDYALNYR